MGWCHRVMGEHRKVLEGLSEEVTFALRTEWERSSYSKCCGNSNVDQGKNLYKSPKVGISLSCLRQCGWNIVSEDGTVEMRTERSAVGRWGKPNIFRFYCQYSGKPSGVLSCGVTQFGLCFERSVHLWNGEEILGEQSGQVSYSRWGGIHLCATGGCRESSCSSYDNCFPAWVVFRISQF